MMTNLLRKLKKLHQQRLIQLIQHLQTPLNLLQLLQTHQLLTTVLNKTLLLLKNNLKLLKLLKKPDLQENLFLILKVRKIIISNAIL